MTKENITIAAIVVQGLSAVSIASLTTLIGCIYAWPSYTVDNFKSNQTVLSNPMSLEQVSLLGSVANIGGMAATPFCGFALNVFGRKYSAILFGLPFVIAWTIISFTTSVPLVLTAVGIAGIGAAGQAVTSVYISEISQDCIRGALTTTTASGYFFGLLLSYILGGYLSYKQVAYTHLSLSVLYMVTLMLLKESPVFLVQKGKFEDAERSIAFYRHVDVTSKEVEAEIKKVKLLLDPRINEILQGENDPESTNELIATKIDSGVAVSTESSWKFLRKSESSKRALLTVLITITTTTLMGSLMLQVYAEPLFKEAVPSMSPNLCSILLAIDFLVPCLLCAVVIDRFGRKSLMTVTSVLSGICTVILGSQLHLHWAPHWFTALMIYTFCFIFTAGASNVPLILAAEVFLPEVRGFCNSIVMEFMWFMNFVTLLIFNPLVDILGLGRIFYGFSIFCFITAGYSQFYLPETKGLSADTIQLLFMKKSKINS